VDELNGAIATKDVIVDLKDGSSVKGEVDSVGPSALEVNVAKKGLAASGGPAQPLCRADDGRGGSWSRDDVIVFSPTVPDAAIQRVQAVGTPITVSAGHRADPNETWPHQARYDCLNCHMDRGLRHVPGYF
jgi:hypothetical protein